MSRSSSVLKGLVFASVVVYFGYALYWFVKTVPWIVEISVRPEFYVPATGLRDVNSVSVSLAFLMEYAGFVGLFVRVVGACFALGAAFLFLKNANIDRLRKLASRALLLEGLYYLFYVPAIMLLALNFSALPNISNMLLSTVFSTQILLLSPLLIKLSTIVKNYEQDRDKPSLVFWSGLSYMSLVVAMWITYMLKWREMMAVDPYLFTALSVRILGFMNTVFVQSSAVIFAAVGLALILKKRALHKALKWIGISAILLGLHILIYVIYVTYVGVTRFIQFGELWLIPAIAIGLYLLLKSPERD